MFSCTEQRFHVLLRFASITHYPRFASAAYLALSSDQLIGSFTFVTIPEVGVGCSGGMLRVGCYGWGFGLGVGCCGGVLAVGS